ncbi:hypothetical protein CHELA40_15453 [Chelatococcus asaccharovorans]|nr:hypothetical protein CHELA17_60165 [Chelatococcus asaccharovorans]CAH1682560.1 hypothetical protein CHELA40_15453 [Chelatococcus asaccharovorans]
MQPPTSFDRFTKPPIAAEPPGTASDELESIQHLAATQAGQGATAHLLPDRHRDQTLPMLQCNTTHRSMQDRGRTFHGAAPVW